ncbi:MAG: hypothetical protein NWQ31_00730 [Polaribacter sp.]|nr:hypothetical protein [Polaribacter sp.]
MKTIIIFLSIVFLISCSNTKEMYATSCEVNAPLENLPWLKEIKINFEISASASKTQIIQFTYHNETVFLIDPCMDCADNLTTVYNCEGDKICEFGGIAGLNTCLDFDENSTNKIVLWEN